MSNASHAEEPRRFPPVILVFGAICGGAVFFLVKNDYAAAAVTTLVGLAALSGYRCGAAKILGLLGGIATSVVLAPQLAELLETQFPEPFNSSALQGRLLGLGAGAVIITVVALLTAVLVASRLLRDRPGLTACNRWIGFGFGMVQGTLVVLFLLGGLLVTEPLALAQIGQLSSNPMRQRIAENVVYAAEETRSSVIGPWIEDCNPFEHIVQLRQLRQGVAVMSNPELFSRVAEHPALSKLREKPAIREAMDTLTNDPEIQKVLTSGKPITPQAVMSLMDNPAIMKLIDDPDFLEEMGRVMGEVDPELQDELVTTR